MKKKTILQVIGISTALPFLLSPLYRQQDAEPVYLETASETVVGDNAESIPSQPEETEETPDLSGWDTSWKRKRYRDKSGEYMTGLVHIDGADYYFSPAGSMRLGWIDTEDGKRYADADGKLVTGLYTVDEVQYFFGEDGILRTGWIEMETGEQRYAGKDGALLSCCMVDGYWLDSRGIPVQAEFTLTDEQLSGIDAVLASCPDNVSLVFEDLLSGQLWSWNDQKSYFIASVYKLPYCLWLFQQADEGKIDLDSTITYTAANHIGAAGIIQYSEYGTEYTLHELIADALIYSDNTALAMLKSVYPPSDFDAWINAPEMGLTGRMSDSTDTMMNAADCATFARMAFEYMESGSKHAGEFQAAYTNPDDYLLHSQWTTGQKYGWWLNALHSCTVVYGDRPYAIAICSDWENRTETDEENFQRIYEAVDALFSE